MATSRRSIDPAPSGRDWRFETVQLFEDLIQVHLGCLYWHEAMGKAMSVSMANGVVKVKFVNEWPGAEADRSIVLILERQCQVGAQGTVRMGCRVVQSGKAIGQFRNGQWELNEKVPIRVHKAIVNISEKLHQLFQGGYQG